MESKKIFIFKDGVAYPLSNGYRVRLGSGWEIIDSNQCDGLYQLVKLCRVNLYRYPFVQFLKRTHELVYIDEEIGTKENIMRFTGNYRLYITRR